MVKQDLRKIIIMKGGMGKIIKKKRSRLLCNVSWELNAIKWTEKSIKRPP